MKLKRLKEGYCKGQKLRTPGKETQEGSGEGLLRQIRRQYLGEEEGRQDKIEGCSLCIGSFLLSWHNGILNGERSRSRQGEGLRNVSEDSKMQVDIGTVLN